MSKQRCKVGDLVRVVNSFNPALVGRIGIITEWVDEHDRWRVTIFGSPELVKGLKFGWLRRTTKIMFRDTSLEPLRGEELETKGELLAEVK